MRVYDSPLMLPVRTLDLVRRYGLILLCVFTGGFLLHDLALRGSAWLARKNLYVGFMGLSISVLVLLGTVILMFFAVRHGLPNLRALAHGEQPDAVTPGNITPTDDKGMVDVIAQSILPFLIFYGAWDLFSEEVRTWSINIINQEGFSGYDVLGQLVYGPLVAPLIIAVVSWILRAILQNRYEKTGSRTLGVLTAIFEANWSFFAVISVSVVIGNVLGWITSRVFWANIMEPFAGLAIDQLLPGLGLSGLTEVWEKVSPFVPDLANGLVQPLIWLTITAVVFGEAMDRDEAVVGDSRLARVSGVWRRLPAQAKFFSEFFSRDYRDKWTPLANGVRFALSAGPLLFLTFALCYTALEAGQDWFRIAVIQVVGPHEWNWWFPWLAPLDYVGQALYEVLRVALLATMFDMTLGRGRIRSAAERSVNVRTRAPSGPRPPAARPGTAR